MTMVSVFQDKLYEGGDYSGLVKVYGVEYSVTTLEGGELSVRCTQDRQYIREPQWKSRARVKAVHEFAEWRLGERRAAA